jgi:hypothetical protein
MMAEERTRRWLARHGLVHREATPLLRARLHARHRGEALATGLTVVATLGYLAWNLVLGFPDDDSRELYSLLAFFAALALAAVAALWVQGRVDRRVGAGLARRVAHPSAVRLGAVVGGWFVTAAAVTYGGGALVGAVVAAGADNRDDRAGGIVLLCAVLAFALIGLVGLVEVVRRPAVADDAHSLVDDTLLRREDALRTIQPLLAIAAIVAAVNSRGDLALFVLLGYALVALVAWTVAYAVTTHAGVAVPPAAGRAAEPVA